MLGDVEKQAIQTAYRTYLKARELKPRLGQRQMIGSIARTLGGIVQDNESKRQEGNHLCVIEAGTGTGKTIAYLLATIPLARAWKKQVIVSTATVALQEQIVQKDLPDLVKFAGMTFSYALAKGRARYMCPQKLDRLTSGQANDPTMALFEQDTLQDKDQLAVFESLLKEWATGAWDGDKDALIDPLPDNLWSRVTTDHQQCSRHRCQFYNQCPFYKARESVEEADCIVANHDLVLADLSLGGGVILPAPEKAIYVFDEGHHLPDKALGHFTFSMTLRGTDRWLKQLNKSMASMAAQLRLTGEMVRAVEQIPSEIRPLEQNLLYLNELISNLVTWDDFADNARPVHRFAEGRVPGEVQTIAEQLRQGFVALSALLDRLNRGLQQAMGGDDPDLSAKEAESWFPVVGQMLARVQDARALCGTYANSDPEGAIPLARWAERLDYQDTLDTNLCSSPILAAERLRQNLWNRCFAAVVCSATLTALNRFDRLMMRAGLPSDGCYERVQSPFDYPAAAELWVPKIQAEPGNADAHTAEITRWLESTLDANEGSLVLFSSRRQMEAVKEAMIPRWQERVTAQGEMSKQEVLRIHKERIDDGEGSVLFGLASFAEGIDLPGKYLTHVIIAKIPFAVPDNPVDAGLAEWIEKRGGNPFMEISMPDASIRLVQAAGRLLRTEQDTGRITLLDRRVVSKRYGKTLLDALPPFRRRID
ncbi:ATP-dependent DNA helicase DinG [Pokkaliibacter sp. CJK22405]|uniref:ATP-dependent DNA helicase DinG n=1 Tax=Pokkaliibacter sp. CJK22405 TaxID=3384615 RepID=UPI0039846570